MEWHVTCVDTTMPVHCWDKWIVLWPDRPWLAPTFITASPWGQDSAFTPRQPPHLWPKASAQPRTSNSWGGLQITNRHRKHVIPNSWTPVIYHLIHENLWRSSEAHDSTWIIKKLISHDNSEETWEDDKCKMLWNIVTTEGTLQPAALRLNWSLFSPSIYLILAGTWS